MANLVIVPAWQRADLFQATLNKITLADDWDKQCYLFVFDIGASAEVLTVGRSFIAAHPDVIVNVLPITGPKYHGNSAALIKAYRWAYDLHEYIKLDLVDLIEEDIWISRDYFTFREQAHKEFPEVFAVSACANQFTKIQDPNDPAGVYLHNRYQSLAVSFKAETLKYIIIHDTTLYYENMLFYCTALFPNSRFRGNLTEQDGLIDRIMERYNFQCLYPFAPRASHVGWVSYHRDGQPLEGSLEDRVTRLEAMTEQEINSRTQKKDISFCRFDGYEPQELVLRGIK